MSNYINEMEQIINLIESGEYEKGLDRLNLIPRDVLNYTEKIVLSKLYLDLGFISQSKDIIEGIEENDNEIIRIKAEIFFKEGKNDKAIELMNDLIKDNPTSWDCFFISQIYFDEGLPEVSFRYINIAIDKGESIPLYFHYKGVYAFELGDIDETIQSFKKAIELDEDESIYHLALAEAYFNYGIFEEALEELDTVLKIDSEQEEALYLKGILLVQINNIEEGIKNLKKLSNKVPENTNVLISLSDAYDRLNNQEESIRILEKVIEFDEFNINAYKRLGDLYLYKGEHQEAYEMFSKVLEINPDDEATKIKINEL